MLTKLKIVPTKNKQIIKSFYKVLIKKQHIIQKNEVVRGGMIPQKVTPQPAILEFLDYKITTTKTIQYNCKVTVFKQTELQTEQSKQMKNEKNTKERILKKIFNTAANTRNHAGTPPINYLSAIPQMILSRFNFSKKNGYVFNDIVNALKNQNTGENKQHKYYATILKIQNAQTSSTNYQPIITFFNKTLNKNNNKVFNLYTKVYYTAINNYNSVKYKFFFSFFVIQFLESYLSKKIWLQINTKDTINAHWKNHINKYIYKNIFLYRKFHKIIPIKELLEIFWLTLQTHDMQILLNFLKNKFETTHFKKHKKLLSLFFDVIKKNKFIFEILGIKGFFFDIRGKVGVSGNAKKRHNCFSIGKITTTSQNTNSYFQQISVWTPTGQMGITCIMQY